MFSRLKRGRKKDCQSSSDASNGGPFANSSRIPVSALVPSSSSCAARATSGPRDVIVRVEGGGALVFVEERACLLRRRRNLRVRGGTVVFQVGVPENVSTGEEFQVNAGHRIVRVRCPPDSRTGQILQITVPAYLVSIPEGVRGGQQLPVSIQGQQLMVTCPHNARPGKSVCVVPPPPPGPLRRKCSRSFDAKVQMCGEPVKLSYDKDGWTRIIRVTDMKFQWVRMDDKGDIELKKRFNVEKPAYVRKLDFLEGEDPRIREGIISLVPASEAVMDSKITSADDRDLVSYADIAAAQVKSFERKTQWFHDTCAQLCVERNEGHIRMKVRRDHLLSDSIHMVMCLTRKDLRKVWRFEFVGETEGNTQEEQPGPEALAMPRSNDDKDCRNEGMPRFSRSGAVLTPEEWQTIAKRRGICNVCGRQTYKNRRFGQNKPLNNEKVLNGICLVCHPITDVRHRDSMVRDGWAREWFRLVTEEVFDPRMGLWQASATNQKCMQINPASETTPKKIDETETSLQEDHLIYFRFLGRVMGRALFDRQLVAGHMSQYIYKHILGWPVSFADLELVDEEYLNYLKQLEHKAKMGEDLEKLCLNFTVPQKALGSKESVELVEGGADIKVTNENFPEYLEACFKYRMMGQVKTQLNQLLLGFFDVIPEPLLTIFDFEELELLICGPPEIDMAD